MKSSRLLLATLMSLCISAPIHAQILIGQTAGFSGAVAAGVKETLDGAKLLIDSVNAKGGVGGQQIEIISLDDKFTPKLAAENAKILIEEKNVVAMFLTRGTPHNQAIIPLLDKHAVPLIAPSTGAMVLHQPLQKHVFNVRSTYQHEAEKAVLHLATIGITKIGVVYSNDTFGADGLVGVQKGLAAAKLTPVAVEMFVRGNADFSKIGPQMMKTGAQNVIVIAAGNEVVECVKAVRAAGSQAQIVTLSNNASGGFIKSLGKDGQGVVVTQVFPQSISFPMVKEASDLARAKGMSEVSPAMLEGFAGAKVLVEALRRTGGKPTRARIQAALEGMSKFDLGGLEVSFSPTDHSGLVFADLSIITAAGKFRR